VCVNVCVCVCVCFLFHSLAEMFIKRAYILTSVLLVIHIAE